MIVPDPKGFTIGSPESEQGHQTDENSSTDPLGEVLAIGKFEVTRAQLKPVGYSRAVAAPGTARIRSGNSTRSAIGSSPGSIKAPTNR